MLTSIRRAAKSASDFCYFVGGGLALIPMGLMRVLFPGSGAGVAMGQWALGALLLLPITGPLFLTGWLLQKVFCTDSLPREGT